MKKVLVVLILTFSFIILLNFVIGDVYQGSNYGKDYYSKGFYGKGQMILEQSVSGTSGGAIYTFYLNNISIIYNKDWQFKMFNDIEILTFDNNNKSINVENISFIVLEANYTSSELIEISKGRYLQSFKILNSTNNNISIIILAKNKNIELKKIITINLLQEPSVASQIFSITKKNTRDLFIIIYHFIHSNLILVLVCFLFAIIVISIFLWYYYKNIYTKQETGNS